ncbi:MAG: AAA family ATPase [Polyangia bacterium]
MSATFERELELHISAGYPLVFVTTLDERRALAAIRAAAEAADREVIAPRDPGRSSSLDVQLSAPGPGNAVVVIDDVHRRMEDPEVLRLLADVAGRGSITPRTAVVLAPWIELPPELERSAAVLDLPLPSPGELRAALDRICGEVGVLLTDDDAAHLVRVAQGLTLVEAERALRRALIGWPEDAEGARRSVESDKRRALRRSRVLEHVDTPADLDDVGGLDRLKEWLLSRRDAFSDRAREYGLPAPRGLLLMGVQGCGKSLTAKAVAGFWRLPLVRLDLSAVFGQPRPEEALRGALRVAEAMSPVVLWIDEIEKGFDRGGEGPAARLLGGMVTWLQEKRDEVFVVATANRVEDLPPELPRKGRFDEIFFVDLPDTHERREILELHLSRRGLKADEFDLDKLVNATERMTGSEIEQAVIAAMYAAFARGDSPRTRDVERAGRESVSLYETFEKEIKKLREWARRRARPASTDRRKIDLFSDGGSQEKTR